MKTKKQSRSLESYELLARLFASENIGVVIDQTLPTAAFDIKNRTLLLPFWDFQYEPLYHFVIGHEVGHALFTPNHEVLKDNELKPIINIVEDYRIDIKIKHKYPGLVSDYKVGMNWLFNNHFFGDSKRIQQICETVDYTTFLDRLVLYLKVKANNDSYRKIVFTSEELKLVKECIVCSSFDHVIEVSNKILNYLKKEKEEQEEQQEAQDDDSDSSEEKMNIEKLSEGQGNSNHAKQSSNNNAQQFQQESTSPTEPQAPDSPMFQSEIQKIFDAKLNESLKNASSKSMTCFDYTTCDIIKNEKLFNEELLKQIFEYHEG